MIAGDVAMFPKNIHRSKGETSATVDERQRAVLDILRNSLSTPRAEHMDERKAGGIVRIWMMMLSEAEVEWTLWNMVMPTVRDRSKPAIRNSM
jgi:hypothetical protein